MPLVYTEQVVSIPDTQISLDPHEGLYCIKYDPSSLLTTIWGVSGSNHNSLSVYATLASDSNVKYFRCDADSTISSSQKDFTLKIRLSNNQCLFVNLESVTTPEENDPTIGADEDNVLIRLTPFVLNLQ